MSESAAVITGLGAISPLGETSTRMWEGLCEGKCGIGPITSFDPAGFSCKIAGQVPEYKVQKFIPSSYRKAVKIMSRDIQLAIVAAYEAITDSGLVTKGIDPEKVNIDPTRIGIDLGASMISCDLVEIASAAATSAIDGRFDIRKWGKEGIEQVTPLWLLKYLPNMLACHIGIIHDIQGPSNTITCAEASSQLAISEAAFMIQRGSCDIVLTGAADAKINPMGVIRQCLLKRATIENNENPDGACRPFDAKAKGSVFGEGAGMIILENKQHAQKREAKIYAQIAGTGQSSNINSKYERLEPNGKGITSAIEMALNEAQIKPQQLDLIIPHGTGIPEDDLAESRGIETALGKAAETIPAWPTKSMLSNVGAASGALDVIAAAFVISQGKIPAAKNLNKKAAGCNLNIVRELQQRNINYALCCSYTHGGQTAAIVLKKPIE